MLKYEGISICFNIRYLLLMNLIILFILLHRSNVLNTVMIPLLQFLHETKSYFFLDVYPYFPWAANPAHISLDYALLKGKTRYTDPGNGLIYTNLLDQMLDSVTIAMTKLGFPDIRVLISETGWPNAGDIEQPGANIQNAATYNRNLACTQDNSKTTHWDPS
jgi:hypothetical protein